MACVLWQGTTPLCWPELKRILRTMLAVFFPVLSTTALDCCPVDASSSKTARQHTQLVPHRTGSKPTAQFSLPKTCGLQMHPTWTRWITMYGGQCWRPITSAIRNRKRLPNWRKSCRWSETSYPRDQQKKLSKSSQSDWRPVLQLRVDILNIHSNCNVVTVVTFAWTMLSWLCHFCLNDVILLNDCLGIFERAKIARWQHCNADNFRTL